MLRGWLPFSFPLAFVIATVPIVSHAETKNLQSRRRWEAQRYLPCHDLGALAPLRLSDARVPFLTPAKVPSMNASERSKPARLYKSWTRPCRMRSIVPSRHQRWKRR